MPFTLNSLSARDQRVLRSATSQLGERLVAASCDVSVPTLHKSLAGLGITPSCRRRIERYVRERALEMQASVQAAEPGALP